MKKTTFYISTPLYYTNAAPHLGHLYSTLYADFISRYKKIQGNKVFFVTGADQHGEKIFQQSQLKQQTPETFVIEQTKQFLQLWNQAQIEFTHFIATHNPSHQQFVQKAFTKLKKSRAIFLDEYKGKYCTNCESFQNLSIPLEECRICKGHLKLLSEKNFFLKITQTDQIQIKDQVKQWKTQLPNIHFANQLNDFFQIPHWNLSLSRNKLSWGITVDTENEQKAYVWFDALLGYISALSPAEQSQIWQNPKTEIIQVIGKEIMKFHLIYWPLFLKFLNYRFPNNFLIHGWILQKETKMSKSRGNIINPFSLIQRYGSEVIRLYLASLMNPHLDINYDEKNLQNFYNNLIVNDLSNLHFRVLTMCEKYQPSFSNMLSTNSPSSFWKKETNFLHQQIQNYHNVWKQFKIAEAVQIIFNLVEKGNQIIVQTQPWNLYRERKIEKLNEILYCLLLILKLIADLLQPFTPRLTQKIYESLGQKKVQNIYKMELEWLKHLKWRKTIYLYEKRFFDR